MSDVTPALENPIDASIQLVRADALARCSEREGAGFTPLRWIESESQMVRLTARVQIVLKEMGISKSKQRHAVWQTLFDQTVDSTLDLPVGCVYAFLRWVENRPRAAVFFRDFLNQEAKHDKR